MQFDDRLDTVLRMQPSSAAGERTQFRQLLDLLGAAGEPDLAPERILAGFRRLAQLRARLPLTDQATMLRERGLRLRNPLLVEFLARGEPKTAAAAIASARLSEEEWLNLIPHLPVTARGFLRQRRDLGPAVERLLRQYGASDLVLTHTHTQEPAGLSPNPEGKQEPALPLEVQGDEASFIPMPPAPPASPAAPAAGPAPAAATWHAPMPAGALNARAEAEPIAAILERIEQFREARRLSVIAPRLPLEDPSSEAGPRVERIEAICDATGEVIWASPGAAPWLVGLRLTAPAGALVLRMSAAAQQALARHQPLRATPLLLDSASPIGGEWRLDAVPVFAPDTGGFAGYRCCLRRPAPIAAPQPESPSERVRQMLHELRNPVNAIQGFAEVIQQQLFGPAPHEYRAQAAAIATDAARLLAGFDEIERLARLESGTLLPEPGEADLAATLRQMLDRLAPVLEARSTQIKLEQGPAGPLWIALAPHELEAMIWRLLATLAAALAPGEEARVRLAADGQEGTVQAAFPEQLAARLASRRGGAAASRSPISAGSFGPDFTLRLLDAEAAAAGGALARAPAALILRLPLLTTSGHDHSTMAASG